MVLKLLNIEKFTQDDYKDIVKAVFFLVLAIIGGWVGNTLGCTTQKLMINSMLAKHIVLFMIIYFAMDISNKVKKSPLMILKASVSIYVLFILFTKMNIYSTVVVFTQSNETNQSHHSCQALLHRSRQGQRLRHSFINLTFSAHINRRVPDHKSVLDKIRRQETVQ